MRILSNVAKEVARTKSTSKTRNKPPSDQCPFIICDLLTRYEEIGKRSCSRSTYSRTLSEDQEERIEIDIDNNNGDFESSDIAEPVEIIREEVVEVVENPVTETSSMEDEQEEEEDEKNEVKTDYSNRYTVDIYEHVKAQSIQLSGLVDMVQSLQSQVKQLQETIRLPKHKTSSVRKKSTSNNRIKTKKKTKRRGSTGSRK